MIPVERLALKKHRGKDGENRQRDDLLYDLELHKRERSAITDKSYTIGRHLTSIFRQGKKP